MPRRQPATSSGATYRQLRAPHTPDSRLLTARQEYRFLAGSAQEFAYEAVYRHGRQESHRRVYNDLALANDMQTTADAYHHEHQDVLGAEPYRSVSAIIASAVLNP